MVVDPKFPWKLPRLNVKWPRYVCTMSFLKWKALLARARRGDPTAEWEVAEHYDDGCKDKLGRIIVRRSARKRAEWLRRAADHGCASAQNNLGVLLGDGDGIKRNPKIALVWLRKAFQAGESYAATSIAITHRQNGNLRRAVHWFQKSVSLGDDDALIQLGIHYYWGTGIRKNASAAVRSFRKATRATNISEAGRDDAFFYLGLAYCEGRGVRPSIPTAKKLLRRANVDNDHPAAKKMLRELTRLHPQKP